MPVQLYDYQITAINRMKNGCILCGGVGSGKSLTSLAYYFFKNGGHIDERNYYKMTTFQDLYIITTARKRDTKDWEKEYAPFLFGTEMYPCSVTVDSWNNIKKYVDVKDAFFIFDEQRVVGWGVWTKSFLKICKNNQWVLLSATPGDTWSDYIPVFVANGFYRNKTEFNAQHAIMKQHVPYPCVERYIGTKKLEHFRDRILVDMDFKRKTNSIHKDIFTSYDLEKYKTVMKTRLYPFKDEPISTASDLCFSLRRICNEDKSRLEALQEIFWEHNRIIVFYNFDYELEYIKKYGWFESSDGYGAEIAEWNGHRHQPIPDSRRWIYLVQYAACEGWNCVLTDTIVFYSQNYSYKVMTQAAGRIDRLNTPYTNLYYYHLKSRSGIDIAISRALTNKKDFNERRFMSRMEVKNEVDK